MDYQKWVEIIGPYSNAVEELKIKFRNIRKEYLDMGQHSPIEFVTGRTKKISSIMAKMKKLDTKNIEEDIEDIAGIRLMCQFVEDIYTIVDIVKKRTDMRIINEKDYINNSKESGYRSYHLIIMYPINTIEGYREVQCEIQIRTLAMNFWATIEHSLKYKYDHYIPDDLATRLKRAADAAFRLDQEMGEIREEIIKAQELFTEKEYATTDAFSRVQKLKELGDLENYFLYRHRLNIMSSKNDIQGIIELKRELDGVLRDKSFVKSSVNSDKDE
ncbi:MAG: GTP pyrophosphokinase family protein [Peptostreptococcus porci]|uniref:GTP pyrophosphokinase n=1 Tax=Peptostreptococcus porci TaxID=2652282 RepID=UPI002A75F6B7|nr:GTP pyrophosphokinase family protein [Peptostreptococcus porci]MDY2793760.1 GTP pyrophosphokinase family protein [Peptostreptococcus porci]MDY4560427.1 GTP pyrophosphokinase family protein [Peptostreptococcus porci]MDY5479748.1 GTP pyrophosphokinase family protein [Peptostreptococcus porci]